MTIEKAFTDNINLLRRNKTLIDQLSVEAYNTYPQSLTKKGENGVANHSTVGKHIRHILNFYDSLIVGIQTGEFDYDSRDRDPLIETQPSVASEENKQLITSLQELKKNTPPHQFYVMKDQRYSETTTSLLRELIHAQEHATHHYPIIKTALHEHKFYEEAKLLDQLSVAHSTQVYEKKQNIYMPVNGK